MRRYRISVYICLLLMSFMLTACIKTPDELPPQEKKKTSEYSENILLSINQGAAGWGTIYDCMDAEIFIYKDKSVRVMVYEPEEAELMSFELSEEEYEKILQLAEPSKVAKLKVKNDNDVCDGSSYHIALYDSNDERVVYKGGYMPIGKKFWETYDGIKEILEPYKIYEKLEEYRIMLQELEDNSVVAPKAEEAEIFEFLQGEWICGSGSAYMQFYKQGEMYCIDFQADWQAHESATFLGGEPVFALYYESDDEWKDKYGRLEKGETCISYHTRKGELEYGGLLAIDKEERCFRCSLPGEEEEVYLFFPYEEERPIENYIYLDSMAERIREHIVGGEEEIEIYVGTGKSAEQLMEANILYFYSLDSEALPEDVGYIFTALAYGYEDIETFSQARDYDVCFYVDGEGYPIREEEWEIKKH